MLCYLYVIVFYISTCNLRICFECIVYYILYKKILTMSLREIQWLPCVGPLAFCSLIIFLCFSMFLILHNFPSLLQKCYHISHCTSWAVMCSLSFTITSVWRCYTWTNPIRPLTSCWRCCRCIPWTQGCGWGWQSVASLYTSWWGRPLTLWTLLFCLYILFIYLFIY